MGNIHQQNGNIGSYVLLCEYWHPPWYSSTTFSGLPQHLSIGQIATPVIREGYGYLERNISNNL